MKCNVWLARVWWLLAMGGWLTGLQAANDDCLMQRGFGPGDVGVVIDGASFLMKNRKVNLAGIHAPNYRKPNYYDEPYGVDARNALEAMAKSSGYKFYYEWDNTPTTRGGEAFIHAFTVNEYSVQEQLLAQGLAFVLVTAQNDGHLACYLAAEAKARAAKVGIWGFEGSFPYPVATTDQLTTRNADGHRIVEGVLDTVEKSGAFIQLNIGPVGVRIHQDHWANFDWSALRAMKGKTVWLRAYIGTYKNNLFTTIEHPSQLQLLPQS